MNRWELKELLVAAGVPEGDYFIVGVDSQQAPGKGGGFGELVLTKTDDEREWRLVTEERGQVQRDSRFATEDEACETAWQELKPRDQPIRQRTAQDRERARARAREAVADYEAAARQRRETSDG